MHTCLFSRPRRPTAIVNHREVSKLGDRFSGHFNQLAPKANTGQTLCVPGFFQQISSASFQLSQHRLKREDNLLTLDGVATPELSFHMAGDPESIGQAMAEHQAMLDTIRDGLLNGAREIPDDPEERAIIRIVPDILMILRWLELPPCRTGSGWMRRAATSH